MVVVGAGPVGLTLALALAHHGVRSVLLERDEDPVRESRSLFLWARSLEILRDWGALDALLRAGTFYEVFRPTDTRDERPLLSLNFADLLGGATAVPGFATVPQNDFEGVLRRLVGARPECEVRAAECVLVEQDAGGVDVRLRQGGREATLRARYVVGCDGARSTVRGALGLELVGETYPVHFVQSDERVDERDLAPLRLAVREPGFLAATRFGEDLWRVVATVPEGASDEEVFSRAARDDRAHALFGGRPHETLWTSRYRVHRRHAERFRAGRVLLAGDAAHLASPSGGLGLNAGIQDAENAAWKLTAALRGPADAERLVESYDRERREAIASRIHPDSHRNTLLEYGAPALLKRAVFRVARAAVRVRPVGERLAKNFSMLDLRYTDSPLLVGGHRLVGARPDDLVVDGGRRLSGLLRGRAGLLAFGAPGLGEDVAGVPVVHVREVPKGWGLVGPSCVVVRPDRHVGAVVENPTGEALARVLRGALGRGPAASVEAASEGCSGARALGGRRRGGAG